MLLICLGRFGTGFYVIKPDSITAIEQLSKDICKGTIKSSVNRN